MLPIRTVAVLGTDRDSVGLALLCSLAGMEVRLGDPHPAALDAAFHALRQDVERALADGSIGREERQRILDGILITSDLGEATVGADLLFAAGPADAAEARALLARLAGACRATSLLATRLDPTTVADAVPQPGRVVGLEVEGGEGPFPRVSLRLGRQTTEHAGARGARLLEALDRAAGRGHSSR